MVLLIVVVCTSVLAARTAALLGVGVEIQMSSVQEGLILLAVVWCISFSDEPETNFWRGAIQMG
jgi:hypothetical protein